MSNNAFYKLLESYDNINEGTTDVKKIGNQVQVRDDKGNLTNYDEESWEEMNDSDDETNKFFNEDEENYLDNSDAGAFEFDSTIDSDFDALDFDLSSEEEPLTFEDDEYLLDDIMFDDENDYISQPQFSNDGRTPGEEMQSGYDDTYGDQNSYEDDFEQPEYTAFNVAEQGKRLRAGTPIVFDDSIGGGTGTFIEKSGSGFFGTAERNGKSISIHLSDIVAADLTHPDIYESYESAFNEYLGEEITVTHTENLENPENNTTTVTGTDADADELANILQLSGMQEEEVYQEVPMEPIQMEIEPMADLVQDPYEVADVMSAEVEPETMMAVDMDVEEGLGNDNAEPEFGNMSDVDTGPDGITHIGKGINDIGNEPNIGDLDDVEEGLGDNIKKGGKWLKRGMQSWDGDFIDSPQDMADRHNEYDTDTLYDLEDTEGDKFLGQPGEHTPAGLQQKLINRNLRKRGERDFAKNRDHFNSEEVTEEGLNNEPNDKFEVMGDTDTQVNGTSGGLNGQKRQYRKEYPGDNIMTSNMNENDSFLNLYKTLKDIDTK